MLGPLPAAAASIAAGGAANSLGVLSQVGGIGSTLGPMAALGMGMGMGPMGMGGMGMRGWMPGTPPSPLPPSHLHTYIHDVFYFAQYIRTIFLVHSRGVQVHTILSWRDCRHTGD